MVNIKLSNYYYYAYDSNMFDAKFLYFTPIKLLILILKVILQ